MASSRLAPGRLVLWLPVAVYMAAIFVASSLEAVPLPEAVSDKTSHAVAYFGLAAVTARAVGGGLPPRLGAGGAIATLLIAVGYGVTDELHQSFVPGRFADVFDVLADAAGALAATGLAWAWGIIAPSRHGV